MSKDKILKMLKLNVKATKILNIAMPLLIFILLIGTIGSLETDTITLSIYIKNSILICIRAGVTWLVLAYINNKVIRSVLINQYQRYILNK